MVQGDKYSIGFKIKRDGVVITDSDCDDVRIQIGKVLKSSEDDTVTYNSQKQMWLYPITQAESLNLPVNALAQVQVKIGSGIYTSSTVTMKVKESLIKEEWTDDNV